MTESKFTDEALRRLGEYLESIRKLCGGNGDDPEEVVEGIREHIEADLQEISCSVVTIEQLQKVLSGLGSPEQVAGVDEPVRVTGFFSMVDAILRDRDMIYQQLYSGKSLGHLCTKLTAIFIITCALYGCAMGSFRYVHPEYFFSDFELVVEGSPPVSGKIVGINHQERAIFTDHVGLIALQSDGEAKIKFNITDPSEPYQVKSTGEEKGYGKIVVDAPEGLAETAAWRFPISAAIKVPALFLLTLALCLPALYVLNLLLGLSLQFNKTLALTLFALAATGIMLAVFVPIVGLFSIVTESYHFAKLMHVAVFGIAGIFGVKVLWEGLARMAAVRTAKVRSLLAVWLLLYSLVGGQIAWSLKPWIGTPYLPATPPFRVVSGNIYVSTMKSIEQIVR